MKAKCTLGILFVAAAMSARAELVVEGGHVRASLPGSATTSAYMTLRNTGTTDVVVTAVTTPAAGRVSMHSTMNHDGMMHMMDMSTLAVPAGKTLVLESGGTHLMLEKTMTPLADGASVELELQLGDGTKKRVRLPVKNVLNEQ